MEPSVSSERNWEDAKMWREEIEKYIRGKNLNVKFISSDKGG